MCHNDVHHTSGMTIAVSNRCNAYDAPQHCSYTTSAHSFRIVFGFTRRALIVSHRECMVDLGVRVDRG